MAEKESGRIGKIDEFIRSVVGRLTGSDSSSESSDSPSKTDVPEVRIEGDLTIFRPRASINELPWAELDALGTELARQTSRNYIVDLTNVEYVGSSQIALFVRLYKAARERGGSLAVVTSSPSVRDVFRIASLDKIFPICDTMPAAHAQLSKS